MSGDDDPVRITLRDVYNAVTATQSTVADLSKKYELQALAALQDTSTVRDHEKRIRVLEHWMWALPATGVAAVAAAVVAFIK
jgi:hypothetical protein